MIGALVVLTNVWAGIVLPLPDVCAPVIPVGGVHVHEILVFGVVEEIVTGAVNDPEQIVCGAGLNVTVGVGFTTT